MQIARNRIEHETAKAILLDDKKTWLPKSQIKIGDKFIDIPDWLYQKIPVETLNTVPQKDQIAVLGKSSPIEDYMGYYDSSIALLENPITKFPMWGHQKEAFNFCWRRRNAFLGMDMGIGKTKVVIDLILNRNHKKILVLCPILVGDVWHKEIAKHNINNSITNIITLYQKKQTGKNKHKLLSRIAEYKLSSYFIIANYASVLNDKTYKILSAMQFDSIICDESHNIKSPTGIISKRVYGLGKPIKYRFCLSGTPIPHDQLDIFAQYKFLDSNIYGKSVTMFKNMYMLSRKLPNGRSFPIGWRNHSDYNNKMDTIMFRASNDLLDLPPENDRIIACEMSENIFVQYKDLEDKFYIDLDGGSHELEYLIVVLNKLHQVANGFYTHDKAHVENISPHKLDALEELLDDIDKEEPIVIFYKFKNDLELITEMLDKNKISYTTVHNWLEWQEGRDHSRIILGQIHAGGIGIDLTKARYCIYYSYDYRYEDHAQSRARIYRPGQTRPVFYYYLVTKGTVEEDMMDTRFERGDFLDKLMKRKNANPLSSVK